MQDAVPSVWLLRSKEGKEDRVYVLWRCLECSWKGKTSVDQFKTG